MFTLKMPIFGQLVEKNIIARTVRTLGTLVASGVPILEALHITRDTSGNAVFERLYQKVYEAIREGEAIAKPMKDNSKLSFHPMALFFWCMFILGPIGALLYVTRMNAGVLDDMVVNMVDVGEETGELDTMLYKVADNYDEEVAVLTESLMSLMEPLLIICPGRHGGVHRHCPVHADDRPDPKTVLDRCKAPEAPWEELNMKKMRTATSGSDAAPPAAAVFARVLR